MRKVKLVTDQFSVFQHMLNIFITLYYCNAMTPRCHNWTTVSVYCYYFHINRRLEM